MKRKNQSSVDEQRVEQRHFLICPKCGKKFYLEGYARFTHRQSFADKSEEDHTFTVEKVFVEGGDPDEAR